MNTLDEQIKNLGGIHVDDFIESSKGNKYARYVLFLFRLNASLRCDFDKYISKYKLFCTYEGKRYRVTGASRLGDIWLNSDFRRSIGYQLRVYPNQVTDWGSSENDIEID